MDWIHGEYYDKEEVVKRPEKKKTVDDVYSYEKNLEDKGYNQALDDMDAYLPGEDELLIIVSDYFVQLGNRIVTAT